MTPTRDGGARRPPPAGDRAWEPWLQTHGVRVAAAVHPFQVPPEDCEPSDGGYGWRYLVSLSGPGGRCEFDLWSGDNLRWDTTQSQLRRHGYEGWQRLADFHGVANDEIRPYIAGGLPTTEMLLKCLGSSLRGGRADWEEDAPRVAQRYAGQISQALGEAAVEELLRLTRAEPPRDEQPPASGF